MPSFGGAIADAVGREFVAEVRDSERVARRELRVVDVAISGDENRKLSSSEMEKIKVAAIFSGR